MPWEPVSFNPQSRPRPGTPHTLFTDGGTEQRGQGPGPGHTLVGVKGWEQDRRLGSDLPDTCPAMTSPHHCSAWVWGLHVWFLSLKMIRNSGQKTEGRQGEEGLRVSCPPGQAKWRVEATAGNLPPGFFFFFNCNKFTQHKVNLKGADQWRLVYSQCCKTTTSFSFLTCSLPQMEIPPPPGTPSSFPLPPALANTDYFLSLWTYFF